MTNVHKNPERGVGDRVGALVSANQNEVLLLGYGTYDGMQIPPSDHKNPSVAFFGQQGIENPKITLDNGDVVWGMECWWGDEKSTKSHVAFLKDRGAVVKKVRISDMYGDDLVGTDDE